MFLSKATHTHILYIEQLRVWCLSQGTYLNLVFRDLQSLPMPGLRPTIWPATLRSQVQLFNYGFPKGFNKINANYSRTYLIHLCTWMGFIAVFLFYCLMLNCLPCFLFFRYSFWIKLKDYDVLSVVFFFICHKIEDNVLNCSLLWMYSVVLCFLFTSDLCCSLENQAITNIGPCELFWPIGQFFVPPLWPFAQGSGDACW